MITELHQHPIRFDRDRHLDVESAERNLLAAVNGALRVPSVNRVLLVPGIRRIEEGVEERLNHANLRGCGAIKS